MVLLSVIDCYGYLVCIYIWYLVYFQVGIGILVGIWPFLFRFALLDLVYLTVLLYWRDYYFDAFIALFSICPSDCPYVCPIGLSLSVLIYFRLICLFSPWFSLSSPQGLLFSTYFGNSFCSNSFGRFCNALFARWSELFSSAASRLFPDLDFSLEKPAQNLGQILWKFPALSEISSLLPEISYVIY